MNLRSVKLNFSRLGKNNSFRDFFQKRLNRLSQGSTLVISNRIEKTISDFKRITLFILAFQLCSKLLVIASLLMAPIPAGFFSDFSSSYYYSDNTPAWFGLNFKSQYRVFCPLDRMSSYIKNGIVEYEDRFFYLHPGFNPIAFCRAVSLNIRAQKIVSGGSTISMQLARLAEPKPRTFWNKLSELFRAVQFEAVFGKNKILELYLNTIPMGGNIQGIEAASFFYFGKTSQSLTFSESALLIGIANSPNTNRPDRFPERAFSSRAKVARRLCRTFGITRTELSDMIGRPVSRALNTFDTDIIPLVERFKDAPPGQKRVLTIDKRLQQMCLAIIKEKMSLQESRNGALILVDNTTMEVKAYIGSPFYSLDTQGVHYNAADIRRSPGSTLKPFIYGRALEKGLVTPKMKVLDVPHDFNGYKPKNYSNTYLGIVPADEALYRSLNIPAISLEEKLGENGIASILKSCGLMSFDNRADRHDLSIVLGSFPLTLENLTELYCSLSNKGMYSPLVLFKNESPARGAGRNGKKILSPEACYVISEMLSGGMRPDLHSSWEFTADKPKVAFKTGTSYGFIDAWTIAYTPKYTVGVWIGSLDNRYSGMYTGSESTSPVAFKVLDELCRENDGWFAIPAHVSKRQVCAVSGKIPGRYCNKRSEEYYIEGSSPQVTCDVHKRIIIDKATGKSVSLSAISDNEKYEEKIIEVWPEELNEFIHAYGKQAFNLPKGDYADTLPQDHILITSPRATEIQIVNLEKNPDSQKIRCAAYEYPDSGLLYWYANGKFIGSTHPSESIFFEPDDKRIEVSVVDEKGRTGRVLISVSFLRSTASAGK